MDQRKLLILQEVIKLANQKKLLRKPTRINFLANSFPAQISFVKDNSRLSSALCTRRAAKSYSCGLHFAEDHYDFPNASYLFIALTRESARNIFWKDVLKAISLDFKAKWEFNETRLECKAENGATIKLMGMDDSEHEQEKALGGKYRWVYIDECGSFVHDLRDIVYKTLLLATADYNGGIKLIGTPTNRVKSFFYDVTVGGVNGWVNHKWSYLDNPYTARNVQEVINELINANPLITETPMFKQMYLGQWVIDLNALVYKYDEARNKITELPNETFSYVLGVDLGYDDATAFSVGAYHRYSKTLYIVESFKASELIISDVAETIKRLQKKYDITKIIVDGSAKQSVEEMRKRHGLSLTPAEKMDKQGFIEIMNSDMITGYIKVIADNTQDLQDEWSNLIWKYKDSGKKEEHPALPNHCADSALYLWRHCYNYLAINKPQRENPHGEEVVDKFWEQEEEAIRNSKQDWDGLY
jgi:hypothetical protein